MGTRRKRTHGTGTVVARANGTFTAQITDQDGRRRSVGTFPTRMDAETALAESIVEGPPPTLDATFGTYLEEWLAERSLTVKPTTVAKDRSLIRTYVAGRSIARVKVRDLRPEDFRRLYRRLADNGKADGAPLSRASIKTIDQTLKAALQVLVDDRMLKFHPIPRRAVKVERTERPWLDVDQVRDLIGFVRFVDPDMEVVVRLGALAGLRRGEICGLRWADVSFDTATATIRRNRVVASGRVLETTPKTDGSAATVSLDDGTVSALRRHQQRRAASIRQDVPTSEYVLCVASGAGMSPNNLAREFRRDIAKYGAANPDRPLPDGIGLHSLRHSFASGLVVRGTNTKVAAEAMRHASVRMMDRYAHLTPSTVGEAVRGLAEEVGT
jgi:integrase